MSKFGLYTRNANESSGHINTVDMPSIGQAEAYFAGVKQLTLEQFRNLFVVKEIKTDQPGRGLLYGNR
jgi:hypothetical protein|tara:strand:- start:499 stop:702 length:204 start_codon:yes stop_codon:yes gene_type:complete